uniref:Uncharacterized protein n=1 Tax=Panagrolaimus superbus TaxID=310955 RepID=A0A914YCD8_9BILA
MSSYTRFVNPDTGLEIFMQVPAAAAAAAGPSTNTGAAVPQPIAPSTAVTAGPPLNAAAVPQTAENQTSTEAEADPDAPSPGVVPEPPKAPSAFLESFKKVCPYPDIVAAAAGTPIVSNAWLHDNYRPSLSESSSNFSCYAPEDGPVDMHTNAVVNLDILEDMERLNAACANSEVCRMVFRPHRVDIKMDTREAVNFPSGVTHLTDFFVTEDVIMVDPRLWTEFTRNTSLIHVSGTLYPAELRRFVDALENVKTLNFLNQQFLRAGSLVDFSRFIRPNITQFMFDSRYTSNSSFIENVMALYGDLFMRKRNHRPCFEKLLLVVTDFCQRKAFATQVERLADMLIDESSRAAVLTTMPADDNVVETLLSQDFKRARPGYLQNADKKYEKFDYWRSCINGKTITIGFRDPAFAPMSEDHAAHF